MSLENMNGHIDKIEAALTELSRNPKGSWTEIMKAAGVPYYGNITGALRKRGIAVPEGTGLKWVGDAPTRTLAALIYEEAKEASSKRKPKQEKKTPDITEETLTRALVLLEKAILHQVSDPVAFAIDILKDDRI